MKSADRTRETWRRIIEYGHKEHAKASCKEKSPNCAERLSIRPLGMTSAPDRLCGGGGGYSSEKRAVEETLKLCPSSNCQIVASFANTCAMIAFPKGGGRSPSEIFVGLDNDPQQAIMKSGLACEAKFGYDKCSISTMKTKTGNALCSGYDYSIYGQK